MKKRNKFSLSHYKLGTCDMGKLIPISWYEVLPGDTIQQASTVFLRFQPMVAPVMTPVRVQLWSFYVPNRLLWSSWEDFRTGGKDGLNTSNPPTVSFPGGVQIGSLSDYLGVPNGYTGDFSLLPARAYYRIWYDYFRDQDLQDPETDWNNSTLLKALLSADDMNYTADSSSVGFSIQPLSWEKDYFTTARPWPQKGNAVTVPVKGVSGTSAITISGNGKPRLAFDNLPDGWEPTSNQNVQARAVVDGTTLTNNLILQSQSQNSSTGGDPQYQYRDLKWLDPALKATLNNTNLGIGTVDLNDIREAAAIQRFEEMRALYGSRYTEYLRTLGVKSSDARLQRPEYLGGIRNTVQFSEVLQTAADGDNPVGTLRGHGIGATKSKRFRRFIEEDGIVMTLMAIRPIALYAQSLYKGFSRQYKEDYWTKELQHIGQQEVLNKELFATGSNPDGVFGYQNRYDEYRQIPSTVCGLFRSTLDYWHLGRIFANEPTLNASFITGSPTKRVFAEQTQDEVLFMASHSVQARRLMSKTGFPMGL